VQPELAQNLFVRNAFAAGGRGADSVQRLGRLRRDLHHSQSGPGCLTELGESVATDRANYLTIWPGLPPVQNLDAFRPVEGWTAVSPTMWMLRKYGLGYRDLSVQPWWAYYHPAEKVGTLWLYYIPPGTFRQAMLGGR
jgi:hypothetical protein